MAIVAKTKDNVQLFDIGRISPLLNSFSFLRNSLIVLLEIKFFKYSNSVGKSSY